MHIGFLTPEYPTIEKPDGGLANYIRKVARDLVVRGHHVSVLCLSHRSAYWRDGNVDVYEVARTLLPMPLARVRRLAPLLPAIHQRLTAKRLAAAMWAVHDRRPFDILQASSYMTPGYALRRNGRVPVVCRVSSYTPLVRSAYGRKRKLAEYLTDWMEIRQVLDADASFAPSQFIANVFRRIEGFTPDVVRTPVELVPTNVDTSFYESQLSRKRYLLFFGTLSRIKGVDLLAGVIPRVLEEHDDLCIVFIGRDDGLPDGRKMMDVLRADCEGFADRLYYHSAIPKEQLFPVIGNSLGVLMPSRVDNYPNACLEAQSLGVPVIGTYESSLDEMITDGETGFLAQNDDSDSLQQAIDRLLMLTPTERAQLQDRIVAAIAKTIAEDRIEQLVLFYNDTIANSRLNGK